jgi:2-hydroxy-6-oxonona-2,4-dienedioate hydrolase
MELALALAVVFLAAAIAFVYGAFARDLEAAVANLSGRSQTIDTDVGRIEYARLGQGAPVLAVHGAAGGFDQGLHMVGSLGDHGYEVIALSRFGYLGSRVKGTMSITTQADAYVAFLEGWTSNAQP